MLPACCGRPCLCSANLTFEAGQQLVYGVQAFLAASLKTDEELLGWFNERLVWNDQSVVSEMLKNGLFVRIYAPQVRLLLRKQQFGVACLL